jgi:hypothetical protein
VVDSNGAVTGLNLRQGGQDISARKVDWELGIGNWELGIGKKLGCTSLKRELL